MGPLTGVRIVELAGLGPGPFAAMMLADAGAEVVRIDRPAAGPMLLPFDAMGRGRRIVTADLKNSADVAQVLALIAEADALIEGYRPGVTEKLGLGPERCLAVNPRLVYGRMTGWGQDGPMAARAGHDINYIALAGALGHMGHADRPPAPPLNLVGDFGGGGAILAFGLVAGILHARQTGRGQVVDAAMVDGAALQMTLMAGLAVAGAWTDRREDNLLDGGAPYYRCYACADGGFVAVGALEPQFYAALLAGLGLSDDPRLQSQHDKSQWPLQSAILAGIFASQPRAHWEEVFRGTDACVTPVLSMAQARAHPAIQARQGWVPVDGHLMPAPAPRFSATPSTARSSRHEKLQDVLNEWRKRG